MDNKKEKNKIDLFFETLANESPESTKFIKNYQENIEKENKRIFIKKICKFYPKIWKSFYSKVDNGFLKILKNDIINHAEIEDIIEIDKEAMKVPNILDDTNSIFNALLDSKRINKLYGLDLLKILEYEINLEVKDTKIKFMEKKDESPETQGLFYYIDVERITKIYIINQKIKKIPKVLSKFKELRYLNLSVNKIDDISNLQSLINLEILWIQENKLSNISSINNLKNITDLRIFNNNIKSISSLENLINLEFFYAHNNEIEDISLLKNLIKLKHLWLHDNKIKDISSLSNLINLESIHIGNNQIEEIPNLEKLNKIETFSCNNCKIKDISNIKALRNIKHIALENNDIETIPNLSNLNNLIELNLRGNNIEDITPLLKIKNLQRCFMENNRIKELPKEIFDKFDKLDHILLIEKNPLNNLPNEIINSGNIAILRYFKSLYKVNRTNDKINLSKNLNENELNNLKNHLEKRNYKELGEYIYTPERKTLLFNFLELTLDEFYLNKIQQIDTSSKDLIPFLEACFYIIGKQLLSGKTYDKKYLLFLFKFQLNNLKEIYQDYILFPSRLGEVFIAEWLQICWVYSYYLSDYHLIKDIDTKKLNADYYYMFPNLRKLDFGEVPKWFNSRKINFNKNIYKIFINVTVELIKNDIIKIHNNDKLPHFMVMGVFVAYFNENKNLFDNRKEWFDELLSNRLMLNNIIIFLDYLDNKAKIEASDILMKKLIFYTKNISTYSFKEEKYWKYLLSNISDTMINEIINNLLVENEKSLYSMDSDLFDLFPKDKEGIVRAVITNYLINNIKDIKFFDLSLLNKENLKEMLNSVDLENDWLTIRTIAETNEEVIIEKINELIENKKFTQTKHLFYEYGVHNLDKILKIIENNKYNFINIDWILRYLRKRLSTSGNLNRKINELIDYFEKKNSMIKEQNRGLIFIYERFPKDLLKKSKLIKTHKSFNIRVYDNKILAENKNCSFGFTDNELDINNYDSGKYSSYEKYIERRNWKIDDLAKRLIYHINNLEGFSFLKIKEKYFNELKEKLEKFSYIFKNNKFINKEMQYYMKIIEFQENNENYYIIEPIRADDGSNKDIFHINDYILEYIQSKLGKKIDLIPYIISENYEV